MGEHGKRLPWLWRGTGRSLLRIITATRVRTKRHWCAAKEREQLVYSELLPEQPAWLKPLKNSLRGLCNFGYVNGAAALVNGSGNFHLFASKLFRLLLIVYLVCSFG
jgi:hypothetical protein